MNAPHLLLIPMSLQEGQRYLLLEKDQAGAPESQSIVTFAGYTACPAVVIVQSVDCVRRRCPRDCLVEAQSPGHYV